MYATYPMDMVRDKSPNQYRGMFHTLSTVLREEGFRALYKGWLPSVIRVILELSAFIIFCSAGGAGWQNLLSGLFDKLFISENLAELDDWFGDLNPESKVVISEAYTVPSLTVGDRFRFERLVLIGEEPP
ncbi:unnamed protein product [Fraxinus pennsylvanica]|uniref:Uncharacterized protein n=1 Tax=Fraxinus pennsylvanica TaxID=56036 RepID=A0AAD1ZGI3_9LAMI|nr:unnamed protein product [Fraxinus pennsylvanica]